MSESEARRLVDRIYDSLDNEEIGFTPDQITHRILTFGFAAIVESLIKDDPPISVNLNSIRVPTSVVRSVSVDLIKAGINDVGLEDLITSIHARTKKAGLDTSS